MSGAKMNIQEPAQMVSDSRKWIAPQLTVLNAGKATAKSIHTTEIASSYGPSGGVG